MFVHTGGNGTKGDDDLLDDWLNDLHSSYPTTPNQVSHKCHYIILYMCN